MAEDKAGDKGLVERELFTNMRIDRVDRGPGDVVKLTPEQVEELEALDPPAVGPVGTLERMAKEEAEAEEAAEQRAVEAQEAANETAARRAAHDRNAPLADVSTEDGPRVTRRTK